MKREARRPSEDRLQETNGQRKDFHMEGRGKTEKVFSKQTKSCKSNKTITARYNINECKIGKEL